MESSRASVSRLKSDFLKGRWRACKQCWAAFYLFSQISGWQYSLPSIILVYVNSQRLVLSTSHIFLTFRTGGLYFDWVFFHGPFIYQLENHFFRPCHVVREFNRKAVVETSITLAAFIGRMHFNRWTVYILVLVLLYIAAKVLGGPTRYFRWMSRSVGN